jgi:hypothetical protein
VPPTLGAFDGNAMSSKCPQCESQLWVCENHPERPWIGKHACNCGAAGIPCPVCNPCDDETPPELPPGFVEEDAETRH